MPFFPEICAELRRLCFTRIHTSYCDKSKLVTYVLVMPDRELTAQVFGDGDHHVSMSVRGCSDTTPTGFRTVEQLREAVDYESTRSDGRYQDPAEWRRIYPERHGAFY